MRAFPLGPVTALAVALVACSGGDDDGLTLTADTGTPPIETDPDSDQDGFPVSTDCDDTDPFVNPNATEICDGVDTDCDPTTDESGASFKSITQGAVDLTADFAAGTKAAPATITIDEDGVLHVCAGEWYVTFDVQVDARISGHGGTDETVLNGGGQGPAIVIDEELDLRVQGVSFTDYVASDSQYGSAIDCSGEGANIQGGNLQFNDSSATVGGALAIRGGCSMSLQNAEFAGNSAERGGHLVVSEGSAMLTNVSFRDGVATLGGGAVAIGAEFTPLKKAFDGGDSEFFCRNCVFDGNQAVDEGNKKSTAGGGALWIQGSSLVRIADSEFTENVADGSGGAILIDPTEFEDVDLGAEDTSFTDNTAAGKANAVSVPGAKTADYDYDGTQTITCTDADGCEDA